ncbi:MAG: hypothetical protein H3C43_01485 [Leptonema sp. (in: Bacteria)]|nr:hypothetical protein [Leptonema sp. (in: bacteria)]
MAFCISFWGVEPAPNFVDSAILQYQRAQFDEARFQLERALADNPALANQPKVQRLQIFLSLQKREFTVVDQLIAKAPKSDSVLQYIYGLRLLERRDLDKAAVAFQNSIDSVGLNQLQTGVKDKLSTIIEEESLTDLPLPFHCNSNIEIGFDRLISDPIRMANLWNLKIGSIEAATAFFISQSVQTRKYTSVFTNVENQTIHDSTISLILQPNKQRLLGCTVGLSKSDANRRDSYRFLFDLLLLIDGRPESFRQAAFRYLAEPAFDDSATMYSLEALHLLRSGLNLLPVVMKPANQLERWQVQERILFYLYIRQAYLKLNRSKDALRVSKLSIPYEKYLALPNRQFPLQELKDRAGEDRKNREALVLLWQLSNQTDDLTRVTDYDQENEAKEFISTFKARHNY